MSISINFSTKCPYCLVNNNSFSSNNMTRLDDGKSASVLVCSNRKCNSPILVVFRSLGLKDDAFVNIITIGEHGREVLSQSPVCVEREVPEHIPESIEKQLKDSIGTYEIGAYWLAATGLRSVIEKSLKIYKPELSGRLNDRIHKLKENGEITGAMAQWAHRVRIEGNNGVHDGEEFSKSEIESLLLFTEMLLTYLFTMPEKVKLAQEK